MARKRYIAVLLAAAVIAGGLLLSPVARADDIKDNYKIIKEGSRVRWVGKLDEVVEVIGYEKREGDALKVLYDEKDAKWVSYCVKRLVDVPITAVVPKYRWNATKTMLYDEKGYLSAVAEWSAGGKVGGGRAVEPDIADFAVQPIEIITGASLKLGSQVKGKSAGIAQRIRSKFGSSDSDFVWVDGVSEPSTVILPSVYDKVFVATGDYNRPTITEIYTSDISGRGPPYYEVANGKTYVHVAHFSGVGATWIDERLVLYYQPNYMLSGAVLPDRTYSALSFDGVDDIVAVADAASIQNVFDGGGTLEAIINPNSDGEANAGMIGNKVAWYFTVRAEAAGKVKLDWYYNFSVTNGQWRTSSTEVDIGSYTYVALTYDNSDVADNPIVYVGGNVVSVAETSTPVGGRLTDVGSGLAIGNSAATTNTFDGMIDEVRLYTRELTPTEITYNANSGDGTFTPSDTTGLVGWWHMDEADGLTAYDFSGNANDGAITGALYTLGYVERDAGNAGNNQGTISWGSNTGVNVTYGEMTSYESYAATANETAGFEMPTAAMPSTWFNPASSINTTLPFYDSFSSVATAIRQPVQTLYSLGVIGLAFGMFIGLTRFTRSALIGYIAMVAIFGVGASMTIIPAWIVFVMIIAGAGIMYLYRQVAY